MPVMVDAQAMAVASGDDELARYYRAYRARVVGLCRRLLGAPDQAEDAAHEVFARAHARWHDFDATRPFGPWILSIATHHCIDVLRRRATEERLFSSEDVERAAAAAPALGPLAALLDLERQQSLRAAIDALPARYRVPLVLSVYQEQSYGEIAAALGVTRSHVAILVFRARQQLRQALAPSGPIRSRR